MPFVFVMLCIEAFADHCGKSIILRSWEEVEDFVKLLNYWEMSAKQFS